jgi:hypothetical protein
MDWDIDVTLVSDRAILLPLVFNSAVLAVKIDATNYRPTWYKAGYLQSFVDLEGESFLGQKYPLSFTPQLIQVPYLNYRLQFDPVTYAENARIRIKQLSTTEIQQIQIMAISYPPVASIPLVGPDIVATIPAVATSTVLLTANLNRAPECLIVNNSNKNLWIVFAASAATSAPPSIKVPANGGAIDIPGSYTGIVTGIWEAAPNGSCVTHEFSYI